MAKYHVGFSATAPATGAAYMDIRTAASDRIRVLEVGLFLTSAVATQATLCRSTTLGTTSTSVVPVAGDFADPAATAVIGTAWSAAPASTAVPVRKIQLPANIGAGVIWTFAYGDLVIPISASLVLLNPAGVAGPSLSGYVTYDE